MTRTAFLVVKHWHGGRREIVVGFLSEDNAREAAGKMVGGDAMIALETIQIQDMDDKEEKRA